MDRGLSTEEAATFKASNLCDVLMSCLCLSVSLAIVQHFSPSELLNHVYGLCPLILLNQTESKVLFAFCTSTFTWHTVYLTYILEGGALVGLSGKIAVYCTTYCKLSKSFAEDIFTYSCIFSRVFSIVFCASVNTAWIGQKQEDKICSKLVRKARPPKARCWLYIENKVVNKRQFICNCTDFLPFSAL